MTGRSDESENLTGTPSLLLHKRLLATRLYIYLWIRFLVAAAIVAGAVGAKYVVGVEDLDVGKLLVLAVLLAIFNIGVFAVVRRYRHEESTAASYPYLAGMLHVTITVDFLFLTVLLWLVGGAKSPFQAFYLLNVIVASILLSPWAASAHALFAYLLLCGLVFGQYFGVVPYHFPMGAVNSVDPLDGRFAVTIVAVQGVLIALTVFLVSGLMHLLRQGEQRLRVSHAELKRVSTIQRDFLHIALHDLKAPIGAATMLVNSLRIGSNTPLSKQQEHGIERILARLGEAEAFLHDFSVLGALDTPDLDKQTEAIDMGALIQTAVAENKDVAHMHHHSLTVNVAEGLPPVRGVERLIREAVTNLITNAIKYTPDNGAIEIRAWADGDRVRIEVEDNGIGIALEDQNRLFQEFVRIKQKDTRLGDVAGSGLGLSIVRRVIEAHHGHVGVTSELGKGSTFFIDLPVLREEKPS